MEVSFIGRVSTCNTALAGIVFPGRPRFFAPSGPLRSPKRVQNLPGGKASDSAIPANPWSRQSAGAFSDDPGPPPSANPVSGPAERVCGSTGGRAPLLAKPAPVSQG